MVEGGVYENPGYMRVNLSLLMILATSSVTSTALQISSRVESTLEESISYRNENLKEASDVLRQSLTGSGITGSDELKQDIKEYGRDNFRRRNHILHTTLGKVSYEETRQLFLNDVLTESLDDGTPKYYNSNILGRYMKKIMVILNETFKTEY